MTRLADLALAHRRLVVLGWAALALVGFATLSRSTGALSQRYTLPGYAGYDASQAIEHAFGSGGASQPFVAVVHVPDGVAAHRRELGAALARVGRALPGSRIASYASTGDRDFVSADGRTSFALVYPPLSRRTGQPEADALATMRRALAGARVGGAPVALTGAAALGKDSGTQKQGLGVVAEELLGVVGALAVLVFVFGSLLALVPLLVALAAIPTTFLLVWAITTATDVSFLVEYFVALIGLGVAIDYALLVVSRWREERAAGLANEEAVRRAAATAGRAVLVSGTTVSVGLLALVVLPVPFLRSIGFAGLLIPLVSVAAASTLLPVVLAVAGPRLDRRRIRRTDRATAHWTRWAELVVRRRVVALVAALAVLAALLVPAFSLRLGDAQLHALSKAGPARAALDTLQRSGIGAGVLSPLEVATTPAAADRTAAALGRVGGVEGAVAPAAWRRGGDAVVDVLPGADPATAAGAHTLARVRDAAAALAPPARVGGETAVMSDFASAIYGSFPELVVLLALVAFVLLARAFRSVVLPLKALALNVLSIGAAWGVVVLVWQRGHGAHALWGLPATHAVAVWIPLMVFAFLFGLSMDYEVFVIARMREEYDRTGSTRAAVVGGLGRTGRLVTSAALILFLAFVAMAAGPETDVKVLATGFAAGIVLDATVVRALLVPAAVALLDRWNWWFPAPLARVLRVPAPEPVPERPLPEI
ncbi:MAG TPA: MMPL family transporter [Gaiellaceae bacterium]|nr:MMPL family transporter [Gaiellaceae bacterium]